MPNLGYRRGPREVLSIYTQPLAAIPYLDGRRLEPWGAEIVRICSFVWSPFVSMGYWNYKFRTMSLRRQVTSAELTMYKDNHHHHPSCIFEMQASVIPYPAGLSPFTSGSPTLPLFPAISQSVPRATQSISLYPITPHLFQLNHANCNHEVHFLPRPCHY